MGHNISKLAATGFAVEKDDNFKQTVLLLHGDGTNGAQNNTFTDSSSNNFTITRNGNTTQGTFSPFSQTGWSNYFDGTGDYLSGTMSADLAFGTSDMSMQCWVYPTTLGSNNTIFDTREGGANFGNDSLTLVIASGIVAIAAGSYSTSVYVIESPSSISANTWTHIAFSRVSGTNYLFINGSQVASNSNSWNQTYTSGRSFYIGQTIGFSREFLGYISNLKAVNGTGFTSVTVPTTPLTATTNTKLLTCQSNRFIDNSASAFTLTANGNVSVQAFSPFAPTAAYDSATNGGSGYFNNSNSSYLSLANSSTLQFGSNDFTIECWVYSFDVATSIQGIIARFKYNTNNREFFLEINTDASISFRTSSNGTAAQTVQTSASVVPANSWTHIRVSKTGTTAYIGVNGTIVKSGTVDATLNSASQTTYIGNTLPGTRDVPLNGYMCDLRVLNGTALSTSDYTVPTAPLTAITNTQLLLNYTNAGIYDSTAKNDLETVGNAQISTTQKKWGSSSMYYDGNGDYLLSNVATTDLYAFGSGDFTIECWIRLSKVTDFQIIYDGRPAGSANNASPTIYMDAATIKYYVSGADRITGSTLSANTWYHIAVARSGTSTKMFVDGTQVGSTYTDSTTYVGNANRPVFGTDGSNTANNQLYGYMQDLRITKGYARYTANFTAPTKAFADQ